MTHPTRPRRPLAAPLASLLLCALVAVPAAGVDTPPPRWMEGRGAAQPFFGTLVQDPRVDGRLWGLMSGTDELFRSDDAGASWAFVAGGVPGPRLAIGDDDPDTLYAGGPPGLARSTDGGRTWGYLSGYTGEVRFLATSPADPDLVLLIDGSWRAHRSTDGGESFQLSQGGTRLQRLLVDPADPTHVLGAGLDGAVLRSTDAGATYSASTGWVGVAGSERVRTVVGDPFEPTVFYAAMETSRLPGFAVRRSTDRGQSWLPSGEGLRSGVTVDGLAADPFERGRLYAATTDGLFVSADGAESWQPASAEGLYNPGSFAGEGVEHNPQRYVYHVEVAAPDTVYTARFAGAQAYVSHDAGTTFRNATPGPTSARDYAVRASVSPADPDVVWLTGAGWVYRSADGGHTYAWASEGLPAGFAVPVELANIALGFTPLRSPRSVGRALVVAHPTDPLSAYVPRTHRVYRTADGGQSWLGGGYVPDVNAVTLDPERPLTLYAATRLGVYKSTDGGAAWRESAAGMGPREVWDVTVAPGEPSTVYASTYPDGLWVSRDRGATWARVAGAGLPEARPLVGIAVSPDDANVLLVGPLSAGGYRSTDGGATFTTMGLTGTFRSAALLPGGHGYLATSGPGGVWLTEDGGATFADLRGASGLFLGSAVYSVDAHPDDPERVVAAVEGGGLSGAPSGAWVLDRPDP